VKRFLKASSFWLIYSICTFLLLVVVALFTNNKGDVITPSVLGILGVGGLIYLTYREGRFLNKISYITFIFMAILCIGTFAPYQKISPEKEGLFFILNFVFILGLWVQAILLLKKTGFIKQMAKVVVVVCIISSSLLICTPSHFHQSYIYTRMFFLVNIAYCIFLISRKGRASIVLGTFGIFAALGFLLFGSYYFFQSKTYVSEKENTAIVTNAVPKVESIINSINTLNRTSFVKDFSKPLADKNGGSVFDWAVENVGYLTSKTEPNIYFKGGQYTVEQTMKSNKFTNDVVLRVLFEPSDSTFKVNGVTILIAPVK
jgi:hypothetical protein